jgi:hypothetical protein
MNNPDYTVFHRAKKTIFRVKILKFFDADPGFGIRDGNNSDPGWKKVGSGIK